MSVFATYIAAETAPATYRLLFHFADGTRAYFSEQVNVGVPTLPDADVWPTGA